ncbi:transketolase family protein [Micromonospora endolithica]|uniref:Transketolase n=1 Tax=Micromonospora endolithica TaxID=230091 RepID=A0A3A9ZDI1_9ACTN|nr:transketolase [Micromonospora endolithica]RKN46482.1 transketolase [Micromonospora endolithica]TWJ25076.1 transketolase [Micromonospora endolithica]
MRDTFVDTTTDLLAEDPRTALVLADISADAFAPAARRHPDRVLNVGIREQLMIGVAGGLALTGLRPVVHSYAPFLVERAYEQIKLDLDHQGVGAVLVSVGASYDRAAAGRTHLCPADVSLIDTLHGWTVRVPGHPAEVPALLRTAVDGDGSAYLRLSTLRNDVPHGGDGALVVVRDAGPGTPLLVAVGPTLDAALAAVADLPVTVAYTNRPRPFDTAGLRALAGEAVILVEPYLAGTSTRVLSAALADRPHRLLALGVGREDLRRYGTADDHTRWHGLDPAGVRRSVVGFLRPAPVG